MKSPFLSPILLFACWARMEAQVSPRLVINELSASGAYEDWVEIANVGDAPTQEMQLSIHDRVDKSVGNEFPVCLPSLPPGGTAVVVVPNMLNSQGEEVALYEEGKLLDSIAFGRQIGDLTYGRLPTGSNRWSYQIPTPGYENSLNPTPQETILVWRDQPRPLLVVAGVHSEPIQPRLGEPLHVTAAVLSVLPLQEVLVRYWIQEPNVPRGEPPAATARFVSAFDDGEHDDGQPGDLLWAADLPALGAPGWLLYQFMTREGGSTATSQIFEIGIGMVTPSLRINEILPRNTRVCRFDCGNGEFRFTDWIELCNHGDTLLPPMEFALSDDRMNSPPYLVSMNRSLAPGEKILLAADRHCAGTGVLGVPFNLSHNGEDVLLYFPTPSGRYALVDAVRFPPLAENVSYGRVPDCNGDFAVNASPTPEGSPFYPPPVAELISARPLLPGPDEAVSVRVWVSPGLEFGSAELSFRRRPGGTWASLILSRESQSGLVFGEIPPAGFPGMLELIITVRDLDGIEHVVPEDGHGYPLYVRSNQASSPIRLNEIYAGSAFCPGSDAFDGVRDVVWTNLIRGSEFGGPPQPFNFVEILVPPEARSGQASALWVTTDPFLRPQHSVPLFYCRKEGGCSLLSGQYLTVEATGAEAVLKLDSTGGVVYLYVQTQEGPVVLDAIEYPPVTAGRSFGRSPDLTGDWALLRGPTPAGPNTLEKPPLRFRRGDANADGTLDLSDAVFILDYLFLGRQSPSCWTSADSDDSGSIDITDSIFPLNFLFLGGPRLPPPFPDCGTDGTPDLLSCASYPQCE